MKCHILILLVFTVVSARAQDIWSLADPGKENIHLDRGWKYHMGDDPNAAFPGHDDATWGHIQPFADIHDSLPFEAKQGIGWMRLKFRMSHEARRRSLAIMIRQSIASEIYLNGRLVRKYGKISAESDSILAFDPRWDLAPLSISEDSIQTLAVRFAVQPRVRFTTYFAGYNPILSIMVLRQEFAVQKFKEIYVRPWMDLFAQGIIFMVLVLHLAFYLMYPTQKANLYFSLAALCNLVGGLMHNYYYYHSQIAQKYPLALVIHALYGVGQILMLVSVQRYLKIKANRMNILLGVLYVGSNLLGAFWYRQGFNLVSANMPFLIYSAIIILSLMGIRKGVSEARILTIGFGLSILGFILFIVSMIMGGSAGTFDDNLLRPPFDSGSFWYLLFILAPPAAMSIFLASDFAKTSGRLQQKLGEVESLSARNLATEKEKQEILANQNQQLETMVGERTAELNRSLHDLKSTQSQLIQSEKMASLGELTAGIAHEIQNPLNFVNNFSEVNMELSDELVKAIGEKDLEEARDLAVDIRSNQGKIHEHGKRADGIVKAMLQHSRSSSGQKEPTDLAALAEEYLNLAFHGMRAKDKSFNVTLETIFDPDLPKVNVVPQDIGRVLLNLYNNAFQAVAERLKTSEAGYEPKVRVEIQGVGSQHAAVSSQAAGGQAGKQSAAVDSGSRIQDPGFVTLRVTDNGMGIPEAIRTKIFQPFFTTKPTGQGTGLGLSLSYDIVTKGHGGQLEVGSSEGYGSTFIVILPLIK